MIIDDIRCGVSFFHFGIGDGKNSDYPNRICLVFLRCLISEFNRLSPFFLFKSHVFQWKTTRDKIMHI